MTELETKWQFLARILSVQHSIGQLTRRRSENPHMTDLQLLDGMRVLCLVWIMMLGVAQFTMSGAVYNPWTLQQYFQTYGYTAVYSSNLGFDEFFFFSSLLMTLKIGEYLDEMVAQ